MSKHSHGHAAGGNAAGSNTAGAAEEKKNDNRETAPEKNQNEISDFEAGGSGEQPAAEEERPASWEEKYAELEMKFADLNDQFLRKAADFENFRKRTNREKQDLMQFANQNLLLDILPVLDDFERAIKSANTSKDFASFYEGVTMIEKRFSSELENKWGLKRFDSEGEPFDPNRHEALQMEKKAGIPEAVVQDDFVKGYLLKDRVIRFAKVKVLMPDETAPAGGEGAAGESR